MVSLRSWPGVALVLVVTFGLSALTAVLSLGALPAVIAVFGWLLLAPALAILTYSDGEADTPDPVDDDPVATLRERYASGELTEAEFEQRLDRLLETEDVAREPSSQQERHDAVRER